MSFDPILAEKRFGYGLSPEAALAPPNSAAQMLRALAEEDHIAEAFPVEDFEVFRQRMVQSQEIWKLMRQTRGSQAFKDHRKTLQELKKAARQAHSIWAMQLLMRRVWTKDALRERLSAFWADHFTAQGKAGILKRGTTPYIEASIRPHLAGKFADLLIAAVTSPLMVHYLDQGVSLGPNSDKAERKGDKAGLNENLAREILELHTLGVGGPYQQADVRQLAELLTGLTYSPQGVRKFRKDFAEPGAETVLGKSYGGGKAAFSDITSVLQDLARHPATARHIAEKLAVHFLSDHPDPALVSALEHSFLESDGDLMVVYETLLTHPAAWDPQLHNIRLPDEFISAAMRGLAVPRDRLQFDNLRTMEIFFVQKFARPLRLMGQPWQAPLGPDGWGEEDTTWLTPQSLANRLQWALQTPSALVDPLPDPRRFVTDVLGPTPPEAVRFAAQAAENRREGIALILASPAFQRK